MAGLNSRRLSALRIVALVVGISLAGSGTSEGLSREEEIRLGQQAAAQIERQYRTRSDATVSRVGQSVAARSSAPSLPYRFRVIEQSQANAFALPGGPIYVTEGLLRMERGGASIPWLRSHPGTQARADRLRELLQVQR
jgi:predicted Zn-dependent protease